MIFNVPQHFPRRKQTFETFHPFSEIFCNKYSIITYILKVFPICCFTICKKLQKQFGWEYKKGINVYCSGPVLNHYDYWTILGQSTRNLIIDYFHNTISILDIWQGSEYASGSLKLFCRGFKRDTREGWYMPNWLYFIILMSYMEVQHSS